MTAFEPGSVQSAALWSWFSLVHLDAFLLRSDSDQRASGTASLAAAKNAADRVSLWKNEGKIGSGKPVKGGLDAPDTLYDSEPKLTGFPLCLTAII
jgi:hypothetical protein